MSNPQRYTLALPDISYGMDESSKGEYVLWRDYAKLKAEVERLRKAGDGLYKSMLEIGCNEMADNFQYDDWWGSMRAWQSAKEDKQP